MHIQRKDYETVAEIPMLTEWTPVKSVGEWKQSIKDHRAQLKTTIRNWWVTGEAPDGTPVNVKLFVDEAVKSIGADNAFPLAIETVDDGWLDAEANPIENPVLQKAKGSKAMQESALEELKTWKRFTGRNGVIKAMSSFECKALPLEIEETVKAELETADDRDAIKAIFAKAELRLGEMTNIPHTDEDALLEWTERMKELGGDFADLVTLPEEGVENE
jgi:hypothetical protein